MAGLMLLAGPTVVAELKQVPYTICDIELTEPLTDVHVPPEHAGLAVLVRRQGRPLGFFMQEVAGNGIVSAQEMSQLIATQVDLSRSGDSCAQATVSPGDSERLPSLTVAVCTRDNPQVLATCLARLLQLRDVAPGLAFEIVVVDNAPTDVRTKAQATSLPGVRYVHEAKPGLNFARNRALQEATGEILAFIDDDVLVDRYWLRGLARAIRCHPDAAAFTGLVLPLELETDAQILFEKRGGFEKSFETIRYGQTLPGHPFYPVVGGKFGTGCNMAFRRQVLLDLGGFDEALDAGAPLFGGGDSDMLYRVVRAGYPLIYEPQFLVFHKHRREFAQLRRQFSRSWGLGLMAFAAKTYQSDPSQRPNVRRLVVWWFESHFRDLLNSLRGDHVLPTDMILAEIWGGLVGLFGAYTRSVARTQRIRRQFANHAKVPND